MDRNALARRGQKVLRDLESFFDLPPNERWGNQGLIDYVVPLADAVEKIKELAECSFLLASQRSSPDFTNAIVSLTRITVAQQLEIRELRSLLFQRDFASFQADLQRETDREHSKKLAENREALLASGSEVGDVKLHGGYKGRIRIKEKSEHGNKGDADVSKHSHVMREVDTNAEISGLLKVLAGASLGVSVKTDDLNKLQAVLSNSSSESESRDYEGEFEAKYDGSFTIGK